MQQSLLLFLQIPLMEDLSKQEHLVHLPAGETYRNVMTVTLI